jgi:hypothetical protein
MVKQGKRGRDANDFVLGSATIWNFSSFCRTEPFQSFAPGGGCQSVVSKPEASASLGIC